MIPMSVTDQHRDAGIDEPQLRAGIAWTGAVGLCLASALGISAILGASLGLSAIRLAASGFVCGFDALFAVGALTLSQRAASLRLPALIGVVLSVITALVSLVAIWGANIDGTTGRIGLVAGFLSFALGLTGFLLSQQRGEDPPAITRLMVATLVLGWVLTVALTVDVVFASNSASLSTSNTSGVQFPLTGLGFERFLGVASVLTLLGLLLLPLLRRAHPAYRGGRPANDQRSPTPLHTATSTPPSAGPARLSLETRSRWRGPWGLFAALAVAACAAVLIVALGSSGAGPSNPEAGLANSATGPADAGAGPANSGAGQASAGTLSGTTFTTHIPDGWALSVSHPSAEVNAYTLTTGHAGRNDLGIASDGVIAITISEYSLATLARLDPGAAGAVQDPVGLVTDLTSPPSGAQDGSASAPNRGSLGGQPAAGISYTYTYEGVRNVQTDLIAVNGQAVATVELDVAPALARQGSSAMNSVIADWRWRGLSIAPGGGPTPPTSIELAADAAAKRLARKAQAAAADYARAQGGYVGLTPTILHYFDPTIPMSSDSGTAIGMSPDSGTAYIAQNDVTATATTYTVAATAADGDTFSVSGSTDGAITRTCTTAPGNPVGGCPASQTWH